MGARRPTPQALRHAPPTWLTPPPPPLCPRLHRGSRCTPLLYAVACARRCQLKAVDEAGNSAGYAPVRITFDQGPPTPVIVMSAPPPKALDANTAVFVLHAMDPYSLGADAAPRCKECSGTMLRGHGRTRLGWCDLLCGRPYPARRAGVRHSLRVCTGRLSIAYAFDDATIGALDAPRLGLAPLGGPVELRFEGVQPGEHFVRLWTVDALNTTAPPVVVPWVVLRDVPPVTVLSQPPAVRGRVITDRFVVIVVGTCFDTAAAITPRSHSPGACCCHVSHVSLFCADKCVTSGCVFLQGSRGSGPQWRVPR
jgi:hypothetical protein